MRKRSTPTIISEGCLNIWHPVTGFITSPSMSTLSVAVGAHEIALSYLFQDCRNTPVGLGNPS